MKAHLERYGLAALLTIFVGYQAFQWFEDRARNRESAEAHATFEKAVRDKAASVTKDLSGARVISVNSYDETGACGWIHLDEKVGSVPFQASSPQHSNQDVLVLVPRLDATEPADWAVAAFMKQLNLVICDREASTSRLPPTPSDAHSAPGVDEPIRALWGRNPPEWAIVPYPKGGFIAMRRHVGGGATISPVIPVQSEAIRWTANEGREQARIEDAKGSERMRVFSECLDRYGPNNPASEACFNDPSAPAATS